MLIWINWFLLGRYIEWKFDKSANQYFDQLMTRTINSLNARVPLIPENWLEFFGSYCRQSSNIHQYRPSFSPPKPRLGVCLEITKDRLFSDELLQSCETGNTASVCFHTVLLLLLFPFLFFLLFCLCL